MDLQKMTIESLNNLKTEIMKEIGSRNKKVKSPLNLQFLINEKITFEGNYYNGGWLKTVTGIDKTKTNGYSLLGDFVAKEGINIYKDGLYIFCSVNGSRKNQCKNYALIKLVDDKVTVLKESDGRDWAVVLWDDIENN